MFPKNDIVMQNTLQYYNCDIYLLKDSSKTPITKKSDIQNFISWVNSLKSKTLPTITVSNSFSSNNFTETIQDLKKPIDVAVYVIEHNIKIDSNNNKFIPLNKEDTNLNRMIFYLNHNHFWDFVQSVNNEKCSIKTNPSSAKSNVTSLPKFNPNALKTANNRVEHFKEWNNIMGKGIFGGSALHYPFGGEPLPTNLVTNGFQKGGEPCNSSIKHIVDSVLSMANSKYDKKEYDNLKETFKTLLEDNIKTEVLINQKVQQLQRLSQSGVSSTSIQSKEIVNELQKLVKVLGDSEGNILKNVQITYTKITPKVEVGKPAYEYLKGGNGDVYNRLNMLQEQLNRIGNKLNV